MSQLITKLAADYFLPYQQAWIKESAPVAVAQKSRRIGWTYAEAYRSVERRVRLKTNHYFSSADWTAGKEFIEYCAMFARLFNAVAKMVTGVEEIDDQEITTLEVRFENGSRIVAGSSNPKFFRSKGGDATLDEFAFHAQARELYKAAQATALVWGHQLRIFSTHNGEDSFFNQGFVQPILLGEKQMALHTVTIVDALEAGLLTKVRPDLEDSPANRAVFVEELRCSCSDEDSFNEEFMCRPSSEQKSLLTYDLIQGCEVANLTVAQDVNGLRAIIQSAGSPAPMYAGFDVGRRRDLSHLWVIARLADTYWTRMLLRLPQTKFSVQEGVLNELLSIPQVIRLAIDETGMGMDLAERLVSRWGKYRVEPVTFTGSVKVAIGMPLVRLFEDRLIRIPREDALRNALHKVRKVVTANGNVRLDAEHDQSGHADEFWSLALAYSAADPNTAPRQMVSAQEVPLGW